MVATQERLVTHKAEIRKDFPESSVFVPRDKEQEYCRRNNIDFRRLLNGSAIIGAFRESPDKEHASITLNFPDGAYNDPSGKEGVSHLLEHLLAYPVKDFATEVDAYVNAATSAEEVTMDLVGSANPEVKNHGVWQVIPRLFHSLFTHLRETEDLPEKLATEKKIIYEEMDIGEAPEAQVGKFSRETLFHPKNPRYYDPIGTRDSVGDLQVDDVVNTAKRIMIPDKAIASVFVNGKEKARDELVDEIEQQMQQFPHADQKRKRLDPELSELINPDLKPGSVFEKQVEGLSPEGAIDTNYVWVFPTEQYTTDDFAGSDMSQLLHDKFFKYMREQGVSYIQSSYSFQMKHSTVIGFHFRVKKAPDMKEKILQTFFSDIQKNVLEKITEKDLEDHHKKIQLGMDANPISTEMRFHTALDGLQEEDRIMDADKIREIARNVTVDDYKKWLNRLTTTLPTTILAGNVND